MNAYERERLLPPDVDVALPDFLSSGVAYKFRPPNGEPVEYFYLENHQLLSIFDDVTVNPADKGLWILHQQGPYMELDNLKIKPSDGNWEWSTPGTTTACSTTPLPVFKREAPRVATGVSHRSQIPIATSAVNWMRSFQDSAGQLNCGAFFKGEKFTGAFSSGGGAVFSAYSNPGTNAWSNPPSGFAVEVVDESSGTLIIRRNLDPLDGSPARRYLGLNPATGGRTGSLHLAWGDQWPDGQPVEADVQWSEVQRRVGLDGIWTTLFDGNAMSMWDESMAYDSSGTVQVFFRVRVRDTQGKYSTWSNVHTATALAPTTMEDALQLHDPWQGGLLAMNYPNPFNPSTTITYRVPEKGRVTLGVCDLLGRHIRLLVDEEKSPGNLSASWDGTDNEGRAVGGGIYFYSIRTGRSALTKKMLLTEVIPPGPLFLISWKKTSHFPNFWKKRCIFHQTHGFLPTNPVQAVA